MTARRKMALAMVMVSSTVPLHVFAAIKPGDKTVAQVCSVCHGAGLMGAPKIGDT